MDGKMSLGVLCACAGLAACGGGGGGVVGPIVPTVGDLDSALPFGTTAGVPVAMLSAELTNGVRDDLVTITFNADDSFTIVLPGGASPPVTVTSAAVITDGPADNLELGTTSTTFSIGDHFIDVHLGEDAVGSDLFILSRIEDSFAPETLAFTVFGDETAPTSLPSGNGVAYSGGFVSDVFDAAQAPVSQMSGTTTITANFGAGNVDVVFNQTGDVTNATISGLNLPISGAQYSGAITSTDGVTAYSGTVQGSFYGSAAEGTAGVFNAVDPVGVGAGDDLEVIGGFTAFQ